MSASQPPGVRSRGRDLSDRARLSIASAILIASIFLADRVGLVDLIAQGYRALAVVIVVVFVAPLLTVGVWRLANAGRSAVSQQKA